jgi:hypothetical protein
MLLKSAALLSTLLGLERYIRPSGDCTRRFSLVSLVSVSGRNWCYLCGTVEIISECETVEIGNIHAVLVQVDENMLG